MANIIWNPDNVLFDFGFYALRWYSILFALGFVGSYIILKKEFKQDGVPEFKLDKLAIYLVVATVIGARLGHCLFYDFEYYSQHPLEIFIPFRFEPSFEFIGFQGLASHGGGIAVLIALFLYSRNYNVNFFWSLDKIALIFPFVAFCIRLGNLMNSEIIGEPTSHSWGFVFVQVDNIPRHPAQLYEAIAYLAVFVFLYFLNRSIKKQPGFLFGVFLILLLSARFLFEFLKENQSDFEEGMVLNMGQILSIPFILLGIVLLVIKRHNIVLGSSFPNNT